MSQVFLSILGLALFTWVAKYLFVLYYYRKKRQEITKLEARTAVLRMLLKAKLKRKGSQMQDQYKDEKEFLASIISKLDLLTTFNFNRSSDYEDVLDILTSISELVDAHTVKNNPAIYLIQQQKISQDRENLLISSGVVVEKKDENGDAKSADEIASKTKEVVNSQVPEFDRWTQLLKYDKGNLYIIKEMVEATKDLKNKIEDYNIEQGNKELQMRAPELIEINGFDGLQSIVDSDQAKAKADKSSKSSKKHKKQKPAADVSAEIASDDPSSLDPDNGQGAA